MYVMAYLTVQMEKMRESVVNTYLVINNAINSSDVVPNLLRSLTLCSNFKYLEINTWLPPICIVITWKHGSFSNRANLKEPTQFY